LIALFRKATGLAFENGFQAKRSNELWQFDMSPSDLKQVEAPLWIEHGRGKPTLMLFSVVDDRSGGRLRRISLRLRGRRRVCTAASRLTPPSDRIREFTELRMAGVLL